MQQKVKCLAQIYMRGTIQSELQWIQRVFTSSSLYLLIKKWEDHRIIVSCSTTRLSQVCKENAHTHKIKKTWCAKVTSCNSSSMITSQPSNCSSNTSDAQHSVCDVGDLTPVMTPPSSEQSYTKLYVHILPKEFSEICPLSRHFEIPGEVA